MPKRKVTPMMRQYTTLKKKYPDAIMLFRVGDFYETFGEDAVKTSQILDIVLTKRANGSASEVELAGFPHHALETYLSKLVRAGHRVAVCDQLEDPKAAKGLVKRGISEVVTPGISFQDQILDHKTNNYLAALHYHKTGIGLALLDISTGEFLTTQGDFTYIDNLLQSFKPSEVLYNQNDKQNLATCLHDYNSYGLEDWVWTTSFAEEKIYNHFKIKTLKGFGIEKLNLGIIAAGAVFHYLHYTAHDQTKINHINKIQRIDPHQYVYLEKFTTRNLELLHSQHEEGIPLIKVLDHCFTAMGSRRLRKWLILPLRDLKQIEDRLQKISELRNCPDEHSQICQKLKQIGDLERLVSRISIRRTTPRQLWHLKTAFEHIQAIREVLLKTNQPGLKSIGENLNNCYALVEDLERYLNPDPPNIGQGKALKKGLNSKLDEYCALAFDSKSELDKIVAQEIEKTAISSLKIGYNKVFGYYLEVTNAHKNKVPYEWIRKQTLVNAERYITEELKDYEAKILEAEEQIALLEQACFEELLTIVAEYFEPIRANTHLLATLDCLCGLTVLAQNHKYCRPTFNTEGHLAIKAGRHPVIEQQLILSGEAYIPNDVELAPDREQIWIISGPNMAGKSALLRQVGLIVLMAQMGSFVPAESADLALIDKLFTRVGASDNLAKGESTFMVEMFETATILNNMTPQSLILMDEIGRGTSTFDGISIAWAIVEFLHNHPTIRPKTLFATHYHELKTLAGHLERVHNYNVAVKELEDTIIFLRKLVPGGSRHSFGINVAQMAGIPNLVIKRANEILTILEQNETKNVYTPSKKQVPYQLQLFEGEPQAYQELKNILTNLDLNTMTPVEAFMKLGELKNLVEQGK